MPTIAERPSIAEPPSESDIFARVIATDEALPPNVARSVLAWKFPNRDVARVRKLQARNNSGTITDRERRELESYVRVGQFVAVMQAKARLTLKNDRGKGKVSLRHRSISQPGVAEGAPPVNLRSVFAFEP